VATAICEKLIRRHPHVFGDATVKDSADQTRLWEALKAEERQARADANGGDGRPVSALDGVSTALPALSRALKLQNRAARVGFDWPEAAQVIAKIEEELAEIKAALACDAGPDAIDEEMGDLLFACVNFARKLGLDPESALRRGNIKFDRRFRHMESLLAEAGHSPQATSLKEMEAQWQRVKIEEQKDQPNDKLRDL
jgi:MazG family protein